MTRPKSENEYRPPSYAERYASSTFPEFTVGEQTRPGFVHFMDVIIVPIKDGDKIIGLRPTDWVETVNEDGTLQLMNSDKLTLPLGTKVKISCPHGPRGL